ncbi:MAG TPA: hypothetical protein VH740_02905 [Vicinamibacterales bacterium]
MRVSVIALLTVACSLVPVAARAQGNGHGHAYGKRNQASSGSGVPTAPAPTQAPSSGGAFETQPAGTGARNFGAWLDDASIMPEGASTMTFSFAYWKTPSYREFDVPVVDGAVGLTRRMQVGVSVPYYHAGETGGPVARGVGDVYVSAKIQLREPTAKKIGVAVTPLVEILSFAPTPDSSRASWAIPVNVEFQGKEWRAFASSGYFSRGAVFASGALEIALSDRTWLTCAISQSHSLERDDLSTALGIAQTRADASGGLAFLLSRNISAFASIGRTLSSKDPTSASVFLAGGISISVAAPVRTKKN